MDGLLSAAFLIYANNLKEVNSYERKKILRIQSRHR
jgi:hypothetical protein